jgi:hypothetical protein
MKLKATILDNSKDYAIYLKPWGNKFFDLIFFNKETRTKQIIPLDKKIISKIWNITCGQDKIDEICNALAKEVL